MLSDDTLDAIRHSETMQSIVQYAQDIYSDSELLSMIFPQKMFVLMAGNLSEGFIPRGPFPSITAAFDHAEDIGAETVWVMELTI